MRGGDQRCSGKVSRVVQRRRHELRGDRQERVMQTVWELGEATVEDVHSELPTRDRPTYNTVQTVMNRLVDRGLLDRERRGKAYVYRARYNEPEFVARAIDERLALASTAARRLALLTLVERLDDDELDDIVRWASRAIRERGDQ
jgi:predicted transcriptional regulator